MHDEDVNGWASKRARTCEATLAPEEVMDARSEGVDISAVWESTAMSAWCFCGFARFNGRWYVPLDRSTVAAGLDPASHPGEFVDLDDAECMALERVVAHWRNQAHEA